jgi:hypothetical protein
MKKKNSRRLIVLTLLLGLVSLVPATQSAAQRGYGMHHGMWGDGFGYDRGGWRYCPYCGGRFQNRGDYEMGPGMMDPRYGRRGMGRGMMGPGYERFHDYPELRGYQRYREPLKKEEALDLVADMLKRSRNPNLKPGDVEDKEEYLVVDILTKDGSLVDKMEVDKETGMMRSAYR